jgi:photosystem II stability/assembly factor-like uncharacterized protein
MFSRFFVFLALFACLLLTPVISAASGGSAYLVEIDSSRLGAGPARAIESESRDALRLAARSGSVIFLHASADGLDLLSRSGVDFTLIAEEAPGMEYYLVGREDDALDALSAAGAQVLAENAEYYIVSVDPVRAFPIHLLESKKRMVPVSEAAAPFRISEELHLRAPARAEPFTESAAVQAMVDSVSEAGLYSNLRELSGEVSCTVGGEPYTILTRYSPTALCRVAAYYLRERFEELGLETEFHYFNFIRTLKSIDFPGGNLEGWCAGRQGTILHTDDGGSVWNPQESGLSTALNSVFMLDGSNGYIAGNGGVLLWTSDGGNNWNLGSTPTSQNLNGVYFLDSGTGYCCGDAGVILKSTDGGRNWVSLASGTSRALNAVVFTAPEEGWAVGDDGTIRHTVDSGGSWSGVSSSTSDDLTDVKFVGAETGWVSTSGGAVLKTVDGASWQKVSTPVSTLLRSLSFASDGLTGWACGPQGALLKTEDGGDTWSDLTLYAYPDLWDVSFVDTEEGWVSGNSNLRHTVNGGVDWTDQRENVQDGDINVIATMPGTTNPDEIYIICGHYDSISNDPYNRAPGADDNGTGTCAALEAARVLRAYDYEATIRFVCFSREEQGLVGSDAYARMISERGDSVAGALNFDMIGYVDVVPEEIEILYNGISGDLAVAFDQAAGLYVPGLDVRRRYSPNANYSDHASFWDRGYPAFCGIEDSPLNNPYYHRTTDRVGELDFDFFGNVVRAAVGALATLARIDTVSADVAGGTVVSPVEVFPNPCVGGARIEMAGALRPGVLLQVYDIEGRLVSEVSPKEHGGKSSAYWDARGPGGEALSPGIYFVRFAGSQESKKVILLR